MRIKFHVGIVIKVIRRSFNLEQRDLAARAQVSISTVQNIESGGDFHFSNLEKIATALNTSARDLLDRIPDPLDLPGLTSNQDVQSDTETRATGTNGKHQKRG